MELAVKGCIFGCCELFMFRFEHNCVKKGLQLCTERGCRLRPRRGDSNDWRAPCHKCPDWNLLGMPFKK